MSAEVYDQVAISVAQAAGTVVRQTPSTPRVMLFMGAASTAYLDGAQVTPELVSAEALSGEAFAQVTGGDIEFLEDGTYLVSLRFPTDGSNDSILAMLISSAFEVGPSVYAARASFTSAVNGAGVINVGNIAETWELIGFCVGDAANVLAPQVYLQRLCGPIPPA